MKSRIIPFVSAVLLFSSTSIALGQLNVFACVPEWAALAEAVGGERLDVKLATSSFDNPETLAPDVGMTSTLQSSDMIVCTGAELESSWLSAAVERAGNPKLAANQPGRFFASEFVKLLVDSAETKAHTHGPGAEHGILHSQGNPHLHGDPRSVQRVAAQFAKRLIAIDPDGKDFYTDRVKSFIGDLTAKMAELKAKAMPLQGVRVVVQHENAIYLLSWLGIETAATIEPAPGARANAARVANIIESVSREQIKFVVIAAYEDQTDAARVAEEAGIPLVKLPYTIGGTEAATDFFTFYEDAVDRLLDGLN